MLNVLNPLAHPMSINPVRGQQQKINDRQKIPWFNKGFDRQNTEHPLHNILQGVLTVSDKSEESFSISQVAEKLGVSQNTVRNWEKELGEFIMVKRDKTGARTYTSHDVNKLDKVNELREQGLTLPTINKVFSTFYKEEEDHLQTDLDSKQNDLQNQIKALTEQQVEELKGYLETSMQSIIRVQNAILSELQQYPRKSVRKPIFARLAGRL